MGSDGFTWGDCVALVETLAWNDPLFRAANPDEWIWHDPARDPLVTILDLLMQINAKTPLPNKNMRGRLPNPVKRPWDVKGKTAQAPKVKGRSWEDMEAWLASRVKSKD